MPRSQSPADYKGYSIVASQAPFVASGPHQVIFGVYAQRGGKLGVLVHEGIAKKCDDRDAAFDAAYSDARKWIDEHRAQS